jgi:S1-C subfamily serine protease
VAAVLAGVGALLAIAACGVIPAPPPPLDTDFIPDVSPTVDPLAPASDGFTTEQHLAVRLRVETCDGWATGSGWILSENQVVTNRHVIEEGTRIEVTTYDGRDYTVLSSQVAPVADLGLLTLDSVFTEVAEYEITGARYLDPLTIIGYPSGDQLTVEDGHYLGAGKDTVGGTEHLVWNLRAPVKPGSSGSAVFNDEGKVVAVVYAGDDLETALAWPVVWLDRLIADPTGWEDNTHSCS